MGARQMGQFRGCLEASDFPHSKQMPPWPHSMMTAFFLETQHT
jgi:hypothetical protein